MLGISKPEPEPPAAGGVALSGIPQVPLLSGTANPLRSDPISKWGGVLVPTLQSGCGRRGLRHVNLLLHRVPRYNPGQCSGCVWEGVSG